MALLKENNFSSATFGYHVQNKGMWKGASTKIQSTDFIYCSEKKLFKQTTTEYSPALIKLPHEAIANTVDHWYDMREEKDIMQVKQIKVNFNIKTGYFSVENSGQGFPIKAHSKGIYIPEAALTKEYTGSSLKKAKTMTASVNGVGLKILTFTSKIVDIETVDYVRKLYYAQDFEISDTNIGPSDAIIINTESGEVISGEKIELSAAQKLPHTKISFLPNYPMLGYPNYTEEDGKIIELHVKEMLNQILIYMRSLSGALKISCPEIYYNKKRLDIYDELMKAFPIAENTGIEYNFDTSKIIVGLRTKSQKKDVDNYSILNCLYAKKGGNHIDHIKSKISNYCLEKVLQKKAILDLMKEYKSEKTRNNSIKNLIENYLFIVAILQLDGVDWGAQKKDEIILSKEHLEKIIVPTSVMEKIWTCIEKCIEIDLFSKNAKESKVPRQSISIKKYKKANFARKGSDCTLFVQEGDSAELFVQLGLSKGIPGLNNDYCGMYNIQGVPVNVRKNISEHIHPATKEKVLVKNDKILKNDRIIGLIAALGLQYDKVYKEMKDIKQLNYRRLIIIVDQDYDGQGNIRGLILNIFETFWPDLLKLGFVQAFETPLLEVKVSNGKRFFNSQMEYDIWLKLEKNKRSVLGVSYLKGLASNNPSTVKKHFENFNERVLNFKFDEKASSWFEIFYGKETNERKKMLLEPLMDEVMIPSINNIKTIDLSYQLLRYTKSFHLYVIKRKVPHVYDGLVPSRRKVLGYLRKKDKNKLMRISELAGKVLGSMNYHHSETSLQKTITKMAQFFQGACNFPLLYPDGITGTRIEGPKKSGSPRYVSVISNQKLFNLIFPKEDDELLTYTPQEGNVYEPDYYVPIIPLAILEHCTTTSVGWKIRILARSFAQVLTELRKLINLEDQSEKNIMAQEIVPFDLWLNGRFYDGKEFKNQMMSEYFDEIEGRENYEICYGAYKKIDDTTIKVVELPIRVWTTPYRAMFTEVADEKNKKAEVLDKFKDLLSELPRNNSGYNVDITFKFTKNVNEIFKSEHKVIKNMDPIIYGMRLYSNISPVINVLNDDVIKHFDKYEELMKFWYLKRQSLYVKRIERRRIILRLKIKYLNNKLNYLTKISKKEINVDQIKDDENIIALLESMKFDKINTACLNNPRTTPNEELEEKILGEKASYNYLLSLSINSLFQTNRNSIAAEINKLQKELDSYTTDSWRTIWLDELSQLDDLRKKGLRNEWVL